MICAHSAAFALCTARFAQIACRRRSSLLARLHARSSLQAWLVSESRLFVHGRLCVCVCVKSVCGGGNSDASWRVVSTLPDERGVGVGRASMRPATNCPIHVLAVQLPSCSKIGLVRIAGRLPISAAACPALLCHQVVSVTLVLLENHWQRP